MSPDTIQVARVDGVPPGPLDEIMIIIHQYTGRVDDVIELIEQQSNFPGGNTQGHRWVSSREVIDA